MANEPKNAKNLTECAAILGVTPQTLRALRRRFPSEAPKGDAGGRQPIAAWRAFLDAHKVKDEARHPENYLDKQEEERRKLRIANERAQIRLDTERGLVVPTASVAAMLRQAASKARDTILALPPQLGAPFGEIGPQIEAHAERVLRDAMERLAKELEEGGK